MTLVLKRMFLPSRNSQADSWRFCVVLCGTCLRTQKHNIEHTVTSMVNINQDCPGKLRCDIPGYPWITAKDPCLPGPGWASFHWLLSILKSPSLLLLHYMKLITDVLSPLIQGRPLLWLAAGAAMRSHSPHPAVCSFRVWAGVQLLFIRWRVQLPRGRKQDPRLLPHLSRCVWAHV